MFRVGGKLSLRVRRHVPLILLLALASSSAALAQDTAPAPAADDVTVQTYKNGIASFEKGDFAAAITDLSKVIQIVGTPSAAVEPAYFDVAVANYNLQKYAEAATAFKTYRDKYPKGTRLNDATMSLANCYIGTKDYANALVELQKVERIPEQREQALYLSASIFIEQKKGAEAIRALEALTADGLRSSLTVKGALLLASQYIGRSEFAKANATVAAIQRKLALVDNILLFNGLIIQLGDKLMEKNCYPQALALYHIARSRKEVIQFQEERIAAQLRTIEENKAKFRSSHDATALGPNQMLFTASTESKRMLDELNKAPNFEPALLTRIARAFQQNDQPREASLVYERIVDKYPDAVEREPAMFGLIASLTDSARPKRALEACDTYLKTFPTGPNVGAVSYLRGAMALDAGDYTQAISYFGSALKDQPRGDFADRISFMTGNAHFLAGDQKSALADYQTYLKNFPSGDYADEANFRIGLCQMMTDQYEEAEKTFHGYLQARPSGEFAPDVLYRLCVIKYAAQEYDQVIADCVAWIKQHPGGNQTGEVYALLGDAQSATDKHEEAATSYINSYKAALATDNKEVLNYSLFEGGKQLSKLGQWEKVADLFEEFVKNHPDHPLTPAAVANVIQARSKLGQLDQAKAFSAQTVARFIGDNTNEATENLLTQLAALCSRRRQPGSDPAAELEKLLTFPPEANVPDSPIVKARRLFAQAELRTFLRKPKEHDDLIYQMADQSKPADLSPLLLGEAGEALAMHDRTIPAREMFEQLTTKFPKSNVLDFGYVGLGELSFKEGDFPKALQLFSKAADDIPAAYRLKEATIGKAKALLALNRLDEAAKMFEQVASTKEWRGEATAQSLCALGDIEAKRGDYAKAIGFYQRVYVGWQKFPALVAKAYIESAHAFEKLGKTQEAVNTYKEMLRNEKIASSDEVTEAKKRLVEMGQG